MKAFLTFLALAVTLSSCVTQRRCNRLYPPEVIRHDSVYTYRQDSIIPGASVVDTFTIKEFRNVPVNRWISVPDTSGRAELRMLKTINGELIAECVAKDQSINKIKELISQKSKEVHTVVKWPWYFKYMIWGFIAQSVLVLAIAFKTFKIGPLLWKIIRKSSIGV